jgi:hypothetical protein
MTTPIRDLLLKIWEDNDYVLTFQTTQESRDIAIELKRLWDVKPEITITSSGPAGIVLEPLLGYFTTFITDLDKDISRETANDGEQLWYLEDIRHGAVKSRDRIVEWQLETIKNI